MRCISSEQCPISMCPHSLLELSLTVGTAPSLGTTQHTRCLRICVRVCGGGLSVCAEPISTESLRPVPHLALCAVGAGSDPVSVAVAHAQCRASLRVNLRMRETDIPPEAHSCWDPRLVRTMLAARTRSCLHLPCVGMKGRVDVHPLPTYPLSYPSTHLPSHLPTFPPLNPNPHLLRPFPPAAPVAFD